ncbi:MAG: hypothetical protein IJ862_06240 [Selenomonadaceae bacterium]|nr:hypothetical protein [Selenomonadaceae bacterium]
MAVKLGNSYVSETALNYAQTQAIEELKSSNKGSNVLGDLSRKFKDVNFSVGTQPFNGKGNNNISISPNVLRQMADDPDKRLEYKALIYDCRQTLKNTANRPDLQAQGFVIGSDGGLRMWSISKSDNSKSQVRVLLNMTEEEFKQRLAGRLPDKELAKRQKIAESLKAANDYLNSRKGEIGFQGGSVSVDKDGNISITSAKATVTFNESKRATQLAAVKTPADLRKLMKILQEDLKECEAGLQNNMCDEAEVEKVKKMIERAQQKINELPEESPKFALSVIDILI